LEQDFVSAEDEASEDADDAADAAAEADDDDDDEEEDEDEEQSEATWSTAVDNEVFRTEASSTSRRNPKANNEAVRSFFIEYSFKNFDQRMYNGNSFT